MLTNLEEWKTLLNKSGIRYKEIEDEDYEYTDDNQISKQISVINLEVDNQHVIQGYIMHL